MTYLDGTELEDFNTILNENNCENIEFNCRVFTAAKPGIYELNEGIIVHCLKTDLKKNYRSPNGSAWLHLFEQDLKANLFKTF